MDRGGIDGVGTEELGFEESVEGLVGFLLLSIRFCRIRFPFPLGGS